MIFIVTISRCPAPATVPSKNSRESPGRKNPISRPVSANTIANSAAYPIQPVNNGVSARISLSGLVRVRNASRRPVIRTPGLSDDIGRQALQDILMDLDLALFHQLLANAVLKKRIPLFRFCALDLVADTIGLRSHLRHVGWIPRRNFAHDTGHSDHRR